MQRKMGRELRLLSRHYLHYANAVCLSCRAYYLQRQQHHAYCFWWRQLTGIYLVVSYGAFGNHGRCYYGKSPSYHYL